MTGRRQIMYQIGFVVGMAVINGMRQNLADESNVNPIAEEPEDADMTESSAPSPGALTLGGMQFWGHI